MSTTKTQACNCPACKATLDMATSLSRPEPPEVGDLAMCIKCGQPLRFGVDLAVYAVNLDQVRRLVTAADFKTFCLARDMVLARRRAN